MNEQVGKKRDWIKNAAIVFLTAMLILTFFSNTIMNYSLPEVSAQYVTSGTIQAKVRGSGTITAELWPALHPMWQRQTMLLPTWRLRWPADQTTPAILPSIPLMILQWI